MITLNGKNFEITIYDPTKPDKHFGTRYSHSGHICNIFDKRQNKLLLTCPFVEFKPFDGDGFPDEFEKPINYDEVKIGEPFLKFGVGEEKKLDDVPYINWHLHPILKEVNVSYESKDRSVSFYQEFSSGDYAYKYVKTIALTDEGYNISHSIENVGKKDINITWYSHCFTSLEGQKEVSITLPKHYTEFKSYEDLRLIDGKYTLQNNYKGDGKCFNWHVDGMPNTYILDTKNYTLFAECDKPCYEFQLYINERIISPEPKLNINVKPNKKFEFTSVYKIKVK